MPFKNIEEEVSWLTADAGARKTAQYLDQLKVQLDDCCGGEGVRRNELAKLEQSLRARDAEQQRLLSELGSLRDELKSTLASLNKSAVPANPS